MQAKDLDEQVITLEGRDGRSYTCRILGVFEFEEKEYVLLMKIGEAEEGDESSPAIMQLVESDGQAVFRTIESDDEFERVVAYVKELAQRDER